MPKSREANRKTGPRREAPHTVDQHLNARPPKRCTQIDRHVGARIRALRRARGMAQAELGKCLGVSFSQIQKYENGIDRVSAARLFAIARLFGVAIGEVFDGLV